MAFESGRFGAPQQETQEVELKTMVDVMDYPTSTDLLETANDAVQESPEVQEGLTEPNRDTFINNGYKTYEALYTDFPEATEQILEISTFITSVKEYAEDTKSDLPSLGYSNDGTFYATITEGDNSNQVSIVRMNPLDGPQSEEIIGQNVDLKYTTDRINGVEHTTATAAVEDELGNKTEIILDSAGNKVRLSSSTGEHSDSLLTHAANLDHKLDYIFPRTHEGQQRKEQRELQQAESNERAFRHL